MKYNLFLILVSLSFPMVILAKSNEDVPLFEKNYLQIDPLYLDYQTVNASNTKYNENNEQLVTSRPSFLFHFNVDDFIFTPFISIDPMNSSSQGSFSAGALFEQTFELGLYTLLNHTENDVGSGSTENSLIKSQFLFGPYLALYPYVTNESYFEIYTRIAYEYSEYKTVTNGSHDDVSDQYGVNLNFGLQYSLQISNKIYFAPNMNFTYSSTNDYGGDNTYRDHYELQVMPVSFQIIL